MDPINDLCKICNISVNTQDNAIICDICNSWVHIDAIGSIKNIIKLFKMIKMYHSTVYYV